MNICETMAFQIAERGWRPFLGWGFAVASVSYAMKAVFGLQFSIEVFGALAAASSAPFVTRAVEKYKKEKVHAAADQD